MRVTEDPILTATETAKVLRLAPQTLANWRHLGKGPRFFCVGSKPRYRMSALLSFIESQEVSSTTQAFAKKAVKAKGSNVVSLADHHQLTPNESVVCLVPHLEKTPLQLMTFFVQHVMKPREYWYYRAKLLRLVALIDAMIADDKSQRAANQS